MARGQGAGEAGGSAGPPDLVGGGGGGEAPVGEAEHAAASKASIRSNAALLANRAPNIH